MVGENVRLGGCLCGQIRFEISGVPHLVEYCHCNSCRKATGAPVMVFAGVGLQNFRITHGDPQHYESSPGVVRTFCGNCGSSLTIFADTFPSEIYVSVSLLDDPNGLEPEVHIWRSHRLPWFETIDDFPRYKQFMSDGVLEDPDLQQEAEE